MWSPWRPASVNMIARARRSASLASMISIPSRSKGRRLWPASPDPPRAPGPVAPFVPTRRVQQAELAGFFRTARSRERFYCAPCLAEQFRRRSGDVDLSRHLGRRPRGGQSVSDARRRLGIYRSAFRPTRHYICVTINSTAMSATKKKSTKRKPPIHAVSRRSVAIVRAVGLDPKTLSLSDVERRALWAGSSALLRRAPRVTN
jgi:hypothetical protein